MDGYNFWRDAFDTYQSLSDWVKMLWLIVPPAFFLALIWLVTRNRGQPRLAEPVAIGRLIYSVYRDGDSHIHIVSHLPGLTERPDLLLLDSPASNPDWSASPAQSASLGGR
jgi:hypothetical protein